MKKRIAIDLDETLANVMDAMLLKFNTENNANYSIEDITSYNFYDIIKEFKDKAETMKFFRDIWKRYKDIPKNPAADIVMKLLSKDFHVDVVTGRIDTSHRILRAWLKLNGIKYDNLVVVKANEKTNLDYDIFVDDCPTYAKALCPHKILVLFDRPWNQNVECKGNVIRAIDWIDVYAVISKLMAKD